VKKALKIFWLVVVALATLLLAITIILQTPAAQTFVAKKVVAALEDNINGKVEFSKVHLRPFNALVLKDVAIIDNNKPFSPAGERLDTMVTAKSIVATFSLRGLARKEGIHIRRANIKDASFTLVSEPGTTNIKRIFNLGKKKDKEKKEPGNVVDVKRVNIENFRFRLVNLKKPVEKEFGINWNDLDITVGQLSGHNLVVSNGYVSGTVDNAEFKEKSGYDVKSLSASTKVGHGQTIISNIKLIDNYSNLSLPEFRMTYDNTQSFSDFLNAVRLTGTIDNSLLDFRSLGYFAQGLKDKETSLHIDNADVDGFVSDLGINSLKFKDMNSGIGGYLEGNITGLPDLDAFRLNANVEDLKFNTDGLSKLIGDWAPRAKVDLGKFAKGSSFNFNGRCSGLLNDLKVDGNIVSDVGNVTADIGIKNIIDKKRPISFDGTLDTKDVDLGGIANVKQLGKCTLRTALHASLGSDGPDVTIDTLFIDRLGALGYDYSGIAAAGTYSKNAFDGRIICNDPNLNLLFQGIFTLSNKTDNSLYNFYANVGYADLHALNIDKRGTSKVSGQINANFRNVSKGEMVGDVDVSNLMLENDSGRHDIGDILVNAHTSSSINRINITSSFADGTYVGDKAITDIIDDLKQLTVERELPALVAATSNKWKGQAYDFDFDLHDSRELLSFVMPGLYIADSTKIRLDIAEDGLVTASVKSPRLAYGKNYIRNINLAFDNKGGSLNGAVSGSEISAASLLFKNSNLVFLGEDNHVGLGFTYDNEEDVEERGEVYINGELERDKDGQLVIHGKTLPSNIYYNGDGWKIRQSSFEIAGKDISVDKLVALCNDQSITIDGGFSSSRKDTLQLDMVKFDLSLANSFLSQDFGIKGLATGKALVTSPWKENGGLLLNIVCDSTEIAANKVGRLQLASSLDDKGEKLHFIARNNLDGKRSLDLEGDFFTKQKELDADIILDSLDLGYISPILSSVFSKMDGTISGKVKAKGPLKELELSSQDGHFDDALVEVDFTKVTYRLNGPFHVDSDGLYFDNIRITDRYDGTGRLGGSVQFNKFRNIALDTRISMNQIEALNTTGADNSTFNGHVFASGNVGITGPLSSILLDINARTQKNGDIHIPLDNASNDKKTDLLVFKEPYEEVYVDPYELMINSQGTVLKKKNDLGVKLRINANQGTTAYVEIDRDAGTNLVGRGQGTIDLEVRPARDLFRINGDYTISEGNVHFNAMNIAQRDFTITDGSSIRFNGEIMDSDLDIDGLYTTKASVATLIADTSSVAGRKTVNCGISISGKLREPSIQFSIDIPDLDPMTQSLVDNALNTEDKIQKQFLALLISNSFIPDEQSGVVNNTNLLYSNVAEIMAGQLNNILQKLDIPLDLGLNYSASESGTSLFDVAVSTQLFNNRVIVNGTVGNREYGTSGTASGDVVGDLDIEIKLDKPGQLRMTLFSHSADDYTNYLDNTQRNGVGIAYQREFNTLKEFFRELFTRKRRNAPSVQNPPEDRPAPGPASERARMKTITITADNE